MTLMIRRFPIAFLFLLIFSPSFAHGELMRQRADITIARDLSVSGRWTLPVNTGDGDVFVFPEYKDYGFTGAFNYSLTGAASENGPVPFSHEAGDLAYVQTQYPSGSVTRNLYVDYATTPPIKSPLVIYEFFVFGGGYFFSPELSISYPDQLTLLSAWPPPQKTKPLSIAYPSQNSYVYPIVALFRPNPLPPGVVVEKEGIYTVAGDSGSVRKVVQAIRGLSRLSSVVRSYLGDSLPSEVVIMITDLDNIKYQYEPSGLAIRPNIILLNKTLLERQDTTDIEFLIAHETTHLVEMEKSLFGGASFIAPWFREGVATAVELELFGDFLPNDEVRARYGFFGSYRDHLLSESELKSLYDKSFNYVFNDSAAYPITTAYALSALVVRDFYRTVGEAGMKTLFEKLATADSSQLCQTCDSELVARVMANISGESQDAVLFPAKDSGQPSILPQELLKKVVPEELEDRVILQYLEREVDQYVLPNGTIAAVPIRKKTAPSASLSAPAPKESPKAPTVVSISTSTAPAPLPSGQKNVSTQPQEQKRPTPGSAASEIKIPPKAPPQTTMVEPSQESKITPVPPKPKKKSIWQRLFGR